MATPADFNPDLRGIKTFTNWYNTHQASITGGYYDKYKPYITQMQTVAGGFKPWQNFWGGSGAEAQYKQQETGMNALLARLGAGPQASDMNEAAGQVGQSYGYSPASWTAIQQGMPDRMNASNVMSSAASIATGLQDSPFAQQQKQARDIAMRQAEAAIGKQLEAVFGERGGLAGFQAAYDMTSQLQSTVAQQGAQESMAMLDRSLSAVNAENGYYQQLVSQGAIQAQDYLKFRWDTMQTGYQDYMVAMDQTLKNAGQLYENDVKSVNDQLNIITGVMAQEMGLDAFTVQNAQAWYDFWAGLATDWEAAGNQTPEQAAAAAKKKAKADAAKAAAAAAANGNGTSQSERQDRADAMRASGGRSDQPMPQTSGGSSYGY